MKNVGSIIINNLNVYKRTVSADYVDLKEVLYSQATVYRWTAALHCGQQSTEDEHRSSRPSNICTEESVQDTILKDRRQTIRHAAECHKLSYGTRNLVICDVFGYSKVPRAGCLLKSRMSACKLPVVIPT